jgi:hypothetical protein
MPAISQIEASIQDLPAQEFSSLLGWMAERHLEVLASGEFEAPEVEAALLKSLDGARYPVDEALFAGIRARAVESKS